MAHQEQMSKERSRRNGLVFGGIALLLLAGGLWSRLRYIRKAKAPIEKEKDRSENLLLNILPAEVAEELKLAGKATARDYEMVSIIFKDFKSFTETSEKLSAAELVDKLNYCFEGFDAIMEKHDIWGDTVNTSSRMANSGEVGRVNISQNTYKQIKDEPDFQLIPKTGILKVNR